jgi:formylglycine-generating enzyme required for sulfatase activity
VSTQALVILSVLLTLGGLFTLAGFIGQMPKKFLGIDISDPPIKLSQVQRITAFIIGLGFFLVSLVLFISLNPPSPTTTPTDIAVVDTPTQGPTAILVAPSTPTPATSPLVPKSLGPTDTLGPTPTQQPSSAPTPTRAPGGFRVDGKGMPQVWVPAGCFMMGSDPTRDSNAQQDEMPQHQVCITQSFWLDQYEVTNAAYQQFIDAGGYSHQEWWSDAGWRWKQGNGISLPKVTTTLGNNYPRGGVSWYEAEAYARWRGGCLPTEAQWEYAAGGKENRIYPWGDTFNNSFANTGANTLHKLAEVTAFIGGISWVGAYNLSGNIAEWANDFYSSSYAEYKDKKTDDPLGPTGNKHVLRGGSWKDEPSHVRVVYRSSDSPEVREDEYGLRIVSPCTHN